MPTAVTLFVPRLFVLASLFLLPLAMSAQERTGSKLLAGTIDTIVRKQMQMHRIPALSISVIRNGKAVFSRSYGWADLENQTPATRDTLYRIGSIAKPITSTAAMVLSQQGKLNLDAPIQDYCPAFPQKPWSVTTRQLLSHLSGVRNFRADSGAVPELFSDIHYANITDSLAIFADDPLIAAPGTKFEPSNYGYDVAGCVLEGASKKPFSDLLQELVFKPAGMVATRTDDVFEIVPHRSRSYSPASNGNIQNARPTDTSNKIPGGGLLSTADDLTRFATALESEKLLDPALMQQMWTPQLTTDATPTNYGLGWMIRSYDGVQVVAHTGEQPGASSILYLIPSRKLAFAVLTNVDAAGLWKLADQLAGVLTHPDKKSPVKGR